MGEPRPNRCALPPREQESDFCEPYGRQTLQESRLHRFGSRRLSCGFCLRQARQSAPAGRRGSQYSYPKFYPNPESTLEVRRSDGAPDTTLATDSEIEAREEEFNSTYGSRYKQSNDGYNRTRTRVYGWE